MDTFKDNKEVAKLCCENNCVFIIVPHNLTKKFQPLDITFNKPAKSFIKEKYKNRYTKQLNNLTKAKIKQMLKFR